MKVSAPAAMALSPLPRHVANVVIDEPHNIQKGSLRLGATPAQADRPFPTLHSAREAASLLTFGPDKPGVGVFASNGEFLLREMNVVSWQGKSPFHFENLAVPYEVKLSQVSPQLQQLVDGGVLLNRDGSLVPRPPAPPAA